MNHSSAGRKIEDALLRSIEASGVRSVLVAVSGGADSVALLHATCHFAKSGKLRTEAVNCNFHLRGEESDRDSLFVMQLCEKLGVRLHSLDYDVEAYLEANPGISVEMACRDLRYADFFRICNDEGIERVAVAHNADDDIETMLLALLRGSGTRGLRGMDSDNGKVIRPLLSIPRKEIEAYLSSIGQDFIIDSSNLTSDYRRNFIRRDVLPLLESRWPGAQKSLSRTLSIMKDESTIIDTHYSTQLARLSPDATTLLAYADGVTVGTILRFLEPFGGNPAIAGEIMTSLDKQFQNRRWKISENHEAILERDRLIIADIDFKHITPTIGWDKLSLTAELMEEIRKNRNHDVIYLPQGEWAYELRRPEKGDRMAPLGMKGTRLVSDIISDAHLNREEKDAIRVLTRIRDGKIIWVPGLKRSRHDLVDPDAEWAYRCTYKKKDSV